MSDKNTELKQIELQIRMLESKRKSIQNEIQDSCPHPFDRVNLMSVEDGIVYKQASFTCKDCGKVFNYKYTNDR